MRGLLIRHGNVVKRKVEALRLLDDQLRIRTAGSNAYDGKFIRVIGDNFQCLGAAAIFSLSGLRVVFSALIISLGLLALWTLIFVACLTEKSSR